MFGTPLYVAARRDGGFMCALARGIVDAIPVAERRAQPCETPEDGLDIHEAASGGPTFRGAYEWSSLKKGKFLFSVSATVAAQLLPLTWDETRPGAPATPPTLHISVEVLPATGTVH